MELSHLALITQVNNVVYTEKNDNNDKNESLEGTLCIASHHLILSSRQAIGQEITVRINKRAINIFYLNQLKVLFN